MWLRGTTTSWLSLVKPVARSELLNCRRSAQSFSHSSSPVAISTALGFLAASKSRIAFASLRTLASWLKQCHLKDATHTRQPGQWGAEVAVGTGEVNWKEFFELLKELQVPGYCCIEREAGDQRVADMIKARSIVEALKH